MLSQHLIHDFSYIHDFSSCSILANYNQERNHIEVLRKAISPCIAGNQLSSIYGAPRSYTSAKGIFQLYSVLLVGDPVALRSHTFLFLVFTHWKSRKD